MYKKKLFLLSLTILSITNASLIQSEANLNHLNRNLNLEFEQRNFLESNSRNDRTRLLKNSDSFQNSRDAFGERSKYSNYLTEENRRENRLEEKVSSFDDNRRTRRFNKLDERSNRIDFLENRDEHMNRERDFDIKYNKDNYLNSYERFDRRNDPMNKHNELYFNNHGYLENNKRLIDRFNNRVIRRNKFSGIRDELVNQREEYFDNKDDLSCKKEKFLNNRSREQNLQKKRFGSERSSLNNFEEFDVKQKRENTKEMEKLN